MTDKEIIKALECCLSSSLCTECPYHEINCCSIERDCLDLINRYEAEIERLKGEVAKEFTCFVGNPHKVERCPYLEELPKVKAEATKEFAERLKAIVETNSSGYILVSELRFDNLVKEMTEGQK